MLKMSREHSSDHSAHLREIKEVSKERPFPHGPDLDLAVDIFSKDFRLVLKLNLAGLSSKYAMKLI